MKKWQQWVFINVMYYSTAFFFFFKRKQMLFSKNVSYFLPFVLYIYSAWMVLQSKQSCLFFILFYFLHNSHLLFNNSDFHLCHFDSLSLWIIKKKKTFSKYSTSLSRLILFQWMTLTWDWKLRSYDVTHKLNAHTHTGCIWFVSVKKLQPFYFNPARILPPCGWLLNYKKNAHEVVMFVLFRLLHLTVLSSAVARRWPYIT